MSKIRLTPESSVVDGFMDRDAVATLSSHPTSLAQSKARSDIADSDVDDRKRRRDELGSEDEKKRHKSEKHKRKKEKKKKDKRREKKSRFIADEVSVGSDEEEDDEDEPEAGADDEEYIKRLQNYQTQKGFLDDVMEGGDANDIAEQLKQRYAKKNEASGIENVVRGAKRFSADCLPRSSDPKVFAVKVRPGTARIVVARIVNKCHAYLQGLNDSGVRQDLGIISVFSVDHVREWIYLESHRRRFVEQALNGLEHVFRYRITEVDPKELMQLLARQDTQTEDSISVGQFVRLKIPSYRNDIARVTRVIDGGRKVEVKVVPREDFQSKVYVSHPAKSATIRPQCFFIPGEALGAALRPGGATWGDLKFDDEGYLIREISTRQVAFGKKLTRPPSIDELVMFYKGDQHRVEEASRQLRLDSNAAVSNDDYRLHDMVRVIQGPYQGTVGRITDVFQAKRELIVEANVGGTRIESRVEFSKVTKYFADGTHINVEHGKNKGDSGTVICSYGEHVTYCSDSTNKDNQVRAEDCRRAQLSSTGLHSTGRLDLYDLVSLSTGEIGCNVGIVGDKIRVLKTDGTEVMVSASTVSKIGGKKLATTDRMGNTINRQDAVVVASTGVTPLHAGRQAEVQVIYGDSVFLRSGGTHVNAGLFVVKAAQVTALSGKKKFLSSNPLPPTKIHERPKHAAKPAPDERHVDAASSAGGEALPTAFWVPPSDDNDDEQFE